MLCTLEIVISPTARLIEFYTARETDVQRLYIVCHELGLGFGTPLG
jgi:hypothetical protein